MAVAERESVERAAVFAQLPIARVIESAHNPRRRFAGLEDLAASIAQVGILEPLLVRPMGAPDDLPLDFVLGWADVRFEIIAGARRFRAAQLAGLRDVPCLVRRLDDAAALEVAIVENLQRSDVHPLDEADGYGSLMAADPVYTVEAIAAKVGKSKSYVRQRLQLRSLVPDVRTAFEDDRITAGHALKIARLDPALQADALAECFQPAFDYSTGERREELVALGELQQWIDERVPLDLAATETQEEFPELLAEVHQAEAAGATVLLLSGDWPPHNQKVAANAPLYRDRWSTCDPDEPGARLGVIVQGRGRGRAVHVQVTAAPPSGTSAASKPRGQKKTAAEREEEQRRKDEEQARREEARLVRERAHMVTVRAATAIAETITAVNAPLLVRVIERLSWDVQANEEADLVAIAQALDLPPAAFMTSPGPVLRRLTEAQLLKVLVVLTVTEGDDQVKAFAKLCGVNLKQIEAAVKKAQTAAERKK